MNLGDITAEGTNSITRQFKEYANIPSGRGTYAGMEYLQVTFLPSMWALKTMIQLFLKSVSLMITTNLFQ